MPYIGNILDEDKNYGSTGRHDVYQTFDENSRKLSDYTDRYKNVAEIRNNRTNHKSGSIANLRDKISQVDNYIKNGHDTTAFIYFKVNDFELDTRSNNSFNHYAISMENQKTGVGQGNQFKIKIAYHKDFSSYSDINRLELALTQMRKSSTFSYNTTDNMNTVRKELSKNVCILKYGYLNGPSSPEYVGMLLKYSVNASQQIVEYTLEGFAGEQVAVNTVNWYPSIEGCDEVTINDTDIALLGNLIHKDEKDKLSKTEIANITTKVNKYYNKLAYQPFLALDCFLYDYNQSVSDNATKYYLLDCTSESSDRLYKPDTLEPVYMSLCRGQTPIQYIEYCIGLFKYKKTRYYAIEGLSQLQQTTPRFVYSFVTDPDDSNKKYICVDVIDDSNSDAKVAYEFTGYASDNALLIDYSLNYDGTVALAVADMYNESENKDQNIYIDSDGAIRAKTVITRDLFVSGEISEVLITKENTWLDRISCANSCSMTTFGLPFEITVGTIFRCGTYIKDKLHHSSGNCFVTGITDKIDNNSFTTSFTMIRLPGKNSAIKE